MEKKGQFWTARAEKVLERLLEHLALQYSETKDTRSSANYLYWSWLRLDSARSMWAEDCDCERKKGDLWLAATCPCHDAEKQMKNSCEEFG
jgi:hypothetical protein